LAVAADLVRAHRGRIDLHSAPGVGTRLTVTVPAAPETATADGPTAADPQPATATGAGPRVLLVEDDTDLRDYLTRLLLDDGWVVQPVPDAESALTAASADNGSDSPDLVITDVVLPGRSGLQLTADLRRAEGTARAPIIVLTARHGDQATADGLAAGADDYITKPFSAAELLARVRAAHELAVMRQSAVDRAETRAEQIRTALESNRVIGSAVGIVMATYRLTGKQAFQLLVSVSQHSNRKLRDVAVDVTNTRNLPARPTLVDELPLQVATTANSG